MGREDLIDDSHFKTLALRSRNIEAWNGTVVEIVALGTTSYWIDALGKIDFPAIVVSSTSDLFTDPHLQDVGFFKSIEDPLDGPMKLPGFAVEFGGTPAGFSRAGAMLGEHTREVLAEAGFDEARIEGLVGPKKTS